jgi:pyruvate,water dikinase
MSKWWSIFRKAGKRESRVSLRSKIERFRSLLDQNNFVLELIAKAGESLGGDLLFDFQYLRRLAQQLENSVRKVVLDLNFITDDRHLALTAPFERILAGVTDVLESRPSIPHAPDILLLHEIDRDLSGAAGEKSARLGEICQRLNFRIPDGFVITSRACLRIFEQLRLADRLRELTGGGEGGSPPAREIEDRLGRLILEARIPRGLSRSIRKAISSVARGTKNSGFYALRSSAIGEDGEFSFAGLHETVLGVPPSGVLDAYKRVLASLFSAAAVVYRHEHQEPLAAALMAVGCMSMVPAKSSGVIYSFNPNDPERDVLIVAASPGLGKMVVDGSGSTDRFVVSRTPPYRVLSRNVPRKEEMYEIDPRGGVRLAAVPLERRDLPAVSDEFLARLAEAALRIERYMKSAQDIEWTEDDNGDLIILQSRPLRMQTETAGIDRQAREAVQRHRVLISEKGTIACRGIGYGRVVVVQGDVQPGDLPDDSVLLARLASPHLAELVPHARAVITDIGSATGHLATITREFRVPAIVDVGTATSVLKNGMEITVDAEEKVVYEGKVEELLRYQVLRRSSFEDTREFRILRRMLKLISPLNLKDPQAKNFTPLHCETYHDIIRFAHEKAVEHFLEGHDLGSARKNPNGRKVEMNVPLDLTVIDIGGGLAAGDGQGCSLDQITCAPLSALLEGLNTPGAWSTEPAGMDLGSFMSSAMNPSVLSSPLQSAPAGNLAIISDRYLNLSLHLGYHFTQVDSYVSGVRNDNYVYFRFAGGLTEIARRSRRAKMIAIILERQDFMVEAKGDIVIGRLKKFERETMLKRMQMLGLLIGFTRQLDVGMRGDSMIGRGVDKFMTTLYIDWQ